MATHITTVATTTATSAVIGSASFVCATASVITPVIVPGLAANKITGELIEQPRVLDSDNGLLRKVGDQFDLFVGKRAHILSEDRDGANEFVVLDHWNDEQRSDANNFDSNYDHRITLEIDLLLA